MIRRTLITTAFFIAGLSSVTAATFTFSNTNVIVINDSASPPTPASPYPSALQVTGVNGSTITKVTVQLHGFAHTFPSDVAIVLVGPEGQNSILLANVGGTSKIAVTNLELTLDDDAASYLPLDSQLASGTYKPTTNTFLFPFAPPAPATNELMGAFLGNFKNTEPNGAWNLFVVDQYPDDSGIITGGWSLTITTAPVLLSISRTQTNAVLSWTNALAGYTLQATPSLVPAAWTAVSPAPIVISGNYTVTNAMTNRSTFYRLAK
jgi:subtilisin-like proprotein convertase family protein